MKTKTFKRFIIALMLTLSIIMALPVTAFAWTNEELTAGNTYTAEIPDIVFKECEYTNYIYIMNFKDEDGSISPYYDSRDEQYESRDLKMYKFQNPRSLIRMDDGNGNQHPVYCIESGPVIGEGKVYKAVDISKIDNGELGESEKNIAFYKALLYKDENNIDVKKCVELALLYGYQGEYGYNGKGVPKELYDELKKDCQKVDEANYCNYYELATQTIIWECVQRLRTNPNDPQSIKEYTFEYKGKNYTIDRNAYLQSIPEEYFGETHGARICYYWILDKMAKHVKEPSFAKNNADNAETYTLKYDSENGYSLTLIDENNSLDDSDTLVAVVDKENDDVNIEIECKGNEYTFKSEEQIDEPILVTIKKNTGLATGKLVAYENANRKQTTIAGSVDNVEFYLKLQTEPMGNVKIVKTSENGKVEDFKFRVYDENKDLISQGVTNSNGEIVINNLKPGTYTVEEVLEGYNESIYKPQNTKTVTVEPGKTANVTFKNELKRGNVKVVKVAEDNSIKGLEFWLHGTSLSGESVSETAITNENGIAIFEDILVGDNYTLEEINIPAHYVKPEKQTNVSVTYENGKNNIYSFYYEFKNINKKFKVNLQKSDSETGAAQGNATLQGAVYALYINGKYVGEYTTNANGEITTKYYRCYENDVWTIKEITAPKGYKLDPNVYTLETDPNNFTDELNTIVQQVDDEVIKGKIKIVKHTDNGQTQIETPEVGAVFVVYLESAGSYENAKEAERDRLVCDEDGFAQTKVLPYGTYVVEQISGWAGRELLSEFNVFIREEKSYNHLLNNGEVEGYIRVSKKDAETGKTIPYANTAFQIYNSDGNLITMKYTYPKLTFVDTFYTDETGMFVTPEKLPYGKNYYLIEVKAPYGYVINKAPIYFDVIKENSKTENEIIVIDVVAKNEPQKGIIIITKTGEVLQSVERKNGSYQPIYETTGLSGAVYRITAAEDIITPDGTVRYTKGQVVSIVTTGANGVGTSEQLYLGKYNIQEVTAPYGMVINNEIIPIELTYAGETVPVTSSSESFVNDRQHIEISLEKLMEHDEIFGIGINNEILSVKFGLFALEDITAADGSVIPKDSLLETVSCDENGKAVFTFDLPVGAKVYVKEIATDEHYIVSDSIHEVSFTYAGQKVAVVEIPLNNGEAFINEIARGTILGKKVDEDGFTIAGAVFGLFNENETVFTEETALLVSMSNEIGVFTFENVPYGNWIVREIKPAPAFVLNENSYPVKVSENKEIVEITVTNRFIIGSVKVIKLDKENTDVRLTGAVFEVYVDVDGDKKYNPDIDMLVGEMTETELGVYVMAKLRYNGYFLHEKTAPAGYIADEGFHYFGIENDGETVIIEHEPGVGFTNNPKKGEFVLTKTDVADGKPLANVGFRIRDIKGKVVAEGYTDKNGEFRVTLRVGKYTYEEFSPLDGYVLNSEKYSFEIKENGDIVKAAMTNERIPQSGDNVNIRFRYGLLCIIALASIILLICSKRDKSNCFIK